MELTLSDPKASVYSTEHKDAVVSVLRKILDLLDELKPLQNTDSVFNAKHGLKQAQSALRNEMDKNDVSEHIEEPAVVA